MKKAVIEKLRDGAHRRAGRYDGAKRWYPDPEFSGIPGAFNVRGPSRAWPWGYLKHFYTIKYARLLAQHRPLLYLDIQGIDRKSETARLIISQAVAVKMGVAA